MRNARKKRKRHERSEKKRAMIIAEAQRKPRQWQNALADQHRSLCSKYYRMWKKCAQENRCLKERIMPKGAKYKKVNNMY